MTQNMGTIDRTIRIGLALAVLALYWAGKISGVTATVLGAFAVIFAITSAVGFCPLYVPLKFSTRKRP